MNPTSVSGDQPVRAGSVGGSVVDLPDIVRLRLSTRDPALADGVKGCLETSSAVRATVEVMASISRALEVADRSRPDIIVIDEGPGLPDGPDWTDICGMLRQFHRRHRWIPVVIIGTQAHARPAVEAVQAGAADYVPVAEVAEALPHAVLGALQRVYDRRSLERTRGDLVAIMSHDLKNPIGNILNYSDLLLSVGASDSLRPEQHRAIARIRANCIGMLDLISDLLDSISLEAGQLHLVAAQGDLRPVIDECMVRAQFSAAAKQIRLQSALPDGPLDAFFDPPRIAQVLQNLLTNAVKFSMPGTVIDVASRRLPAAIEVAVKDQGPGLKAEEIEALFTRFYRASTRPTAGERGSGLGLFIAREIVVLHGGQIWVESEPGSGSTFKFTIPARASAEVPRA